MDYGKFHFGSIVIDGDTYNHDVVIDRGEVCKRKKKRSKQFRERFGHTPVSIEEKVLSLLKIGAVKGVESRVGTPRIGLHERQANRQRRDRVQRTSPASGAFIVCGLLPIAPGPIFHWTKIARTPAGSRHQRAGK